MGTSECFLHTWEYLHDRSHRICKNCGLCQMKSVNDWMKCSFAFLQDHIKRTEGEDEKQRQQQEREEKDRKRALQYLDSLKHKKCLICQAMNVGSAVYCKSCGAAIAP